MRTGSSWCKTSAVGRGVWVRRAMRRIMPCEALFGSIVSHFVRAVSSS